MALALCIISDTEAVELKSEGKLVLAVVRFVKVEIDLKTWLQIDEPSFGGGGGYCCTHKNTEKGNMEVDD